MSTLCEALRAKVTNYLTLIFYLEASKPMVDGFCSKFQGSSTEYIQWFTLGLKLKFLCMNQAKLEPFISLLLYTGFLYS